MKKPRRGKVTAVEKRVSLEEIYELLLKIAQTLGVKLQ